MPHYVCTGGCGGVSDTPGLCQSEECAKHARPLVPCDCEDGEHAAVLAGNGEKDDAAPSE